MSFAYDVSLMDGSFDLYGGATPASPVVLSVPHAGRDYPLALRAALRVTLAAVKPLEDRHVDAVALAARGGETLIVQRRARAWIDLNRGEDERDPCVDEGIDPTRRPLASAKVRSGLGLVPRRALGATPLWTRRFTDADIAARIVQDHRPYHAALGQALAAARHSFGIAILVDLHSMPTPDNGAGIVLGDRFGHAAGARFVARVDAALRGRGIATALNVPYAGGTYWRCMDGPSTASTRSRSRSIGGSISTRRSMPPDPVWRRSRWHCAARLRRWPTKRSPIASPRSQNKKNHPVREARGGRGSGRRRA